MESCRYHAVPGSTPSAGHATSKRTKRLLAVLGVLFGLSILLHNPLQQFFGDLDLSKLRAHRKVPAELAPPPELEGDKSSSQDSNVSKTVVASAARGQENELDWVRGQLSGWDIVVYVHDEADALYPEGGKSNATTRNKGRESNVYLTYIIDHYDELPDYMVFIHGQRYQPHNDDPMYDLVPEIMNLKLEYVSRQGYTSLRCNWDPGCSGPAIEPDLDHEDGFWEIQGLFASTFRTFFPDEPMPDKVAAPCCSQFAVSKEQVLKISRRRYRQIRQYLYNTHFSIPEAEDMKLGIVMQNMWHIIFGKPPVWCGQPAYQCYCDKWGLCNLQCPDEATCKGRWWKPPENADSVPPGWPKQGQGEDGWPTEGWWNNVR